MGDTLQYRRVIGAKYSFVNGEIKINLDGTNNDYFSNIDEIQLNSNDIELEDLHLKKDAISLNFSKPIICNIKSGKYHSSMFCGAKMEGKQISSYVERLEDLSDKIDVFRDKSVKQKKEEFRSRQIDE